MTNTAQAPLPTALLPASVSLDTLMVAILAGGIE
jgi:hypothetical protein